MMAKERGVPTGAGLTSYLTRNERADIVKTNLLTEGLPPQGMWDEMHLHFKRYVPRYAQHPLKYQGIEVTVSLALDDRENMNVPVVLHNAQVGCVSLRRSKQEVDERDKNM